jgi:AcrR family transcriptional regulator
METKAAVVEEYRRASILTAARRVIAQRGLAGASMQAIAAEAGIAKGTLYLYFKDRDELMEHAVGDMFEELLGRCRDVLAAKRPLRETLRQLVRTSLEFFETNRDFLRVYLEVRSPDGEACVGARRRRRPQYRRYLEQLTETFAAAARRGEMRHLDPARVALFFAEGTSAALRERLEHRGRSNVEDLDWIVDLTMDGIGARRRA